MEGLFPLDATICSEDAEEEEDEIRRK